MRDLVGACSRRCDGVSADLPSLLSSSAAPLKALLPPRGDCRDDEEQYPTRAERHVGNPDCERRMAARGPSDGLPEATDASIKVGRLQRLRN